MKSHPVKLSEEEKRAWFKNQIEQRQKVNPLKSEEDLVNFMRFCRRTFKELYGRDVSGSFFRILLNDLGVAREQSDSVKEKRDYIFKLLDDNQAYRDSKAQLKKATDTHFGEKLLPIVFDEIWDEYQQRIDLPKAKMNVDLYGQGSLFPD